MGIDPDPDGDGDPNNNSEPTVIDLRGLASAIAIPVGGVFSGLCLLLLIVGAGAVTLRRRG